MKQTKLNEIREALCFNHGWCRNCGNTAKYDLDGNWWCVTPDCKHHGPKEYGEAKPNWVNGENGPNGSIYNCPVYDDLINWRPIQIGQTWMSDTWVSDDLINWRPKDD